VAYKNYKTIETPKGKVFVTDQGTAVLEWNTNFQPKWQRRYTLSQKFVDSEVLARCEPYIPLRTGMLIKSGILGTDVGSGEVKWIAPYAKAQYYRPRKNPSQTGPLRGPYWFERMKQIHINSILAGAKKLAGAG
jgi:hypothetical protein